MLRVVLLLFSLAVFVAAPSVALGQDASPSAASYSGTEPPPSQGHSRAGRVAVEATVGLLSSAAVLGSTLYLMLRVDNDGGTVPLSENIAIGSLGGLTLVFGTSAVIYLVGELMEGHGDYGWTTLGTFLGTLVAGGTALAAFATESPEVAIVGGILSASALVGGGILGYELSSDAAVFPTAAVETTGATFGVAGTF